MMMMIEKMANASRGLSLKKLLLFLLLLLGALLANGYPLV
jgi:hypothetical protein